MDPVKLARPPVREALIDVQIDGQLLVDGLQALAERFSREKGLNKTTPIRSGIFGVTLSPDRSFETHAQDHGIIGFRIEDEPVTRVVQVRANGFTYSVVGNYQSWEQLRDDALPLLRQYLELKGVERISRLALRYINSLRFPEPRVDLDEYLRAAPQVPQGLPQMVAGFVSRVVLPIPDDGLIAVVTQALEEGQMPPSVILDIDVFHQATYAPTDVAWERVLDRIRFWKNEIFFRHISEKTAEMYI